VTFDIDRNGSLNVVAKDMDTNKTQNITVTASTKMNKADVEKAVKAAEEYAEQDKKVKEKIEVKNEADGLAYNVENMLKEAGDKVSADEKTKIEAAVAKVKEAIKADDIDQMKSSKDELLKVSHKLAEEMYKAAAAKQQAGAGQPSDGASASAGTANGSSKNGDNVVDAEIVDEGQPK
jgi:molecular chaperone DnaK